MCHLICILCCVFMALFIVTNSLDCTTDLCMNVLCEKRKDTQLSYGGAILHLNRGSVLSAVKCPRDNFCSIDKTETCYRCPNGGNRSDCQNWSRHIKCPNWSRLLFKIRCDSKKCFYLHDFYPCWMPVDYEHKLVMFDHEKERLNYYVNLTYEKCPHDHNNISMHERCDGNIDCPTDAYDEKNCTEDFCTSIDKYKCPYESRCIPKNKRCDGDEYQFSLMPPFKCKYNNDEAETMCKTYCEERKQFACPYEIGKANLDKLCLPFNKTCFIPDSIATLSNLTQKEGGYLWRCSSKYNQWIRASRKCDGNLDCKYNEDETEELCGSFISLQNLVSLTFGLVSSTVFLSCCIKLSGIFQYAASCLQCYQPYQPKLTNQEWIQTRTFLSLLFKNQCKEWISISNTKCLGDNSALEKEFKRLHNNSNQLKNVHQYVYRRVDGMFKLI